MTRRDVIRLCYAAIERYYGAGDRAILAALLVWSHDGVSWIRMGEA